jgi:hypothetical protein
MGDSKQLYKHQLSTLVDAHAALEKRVEAAAALADCDDSALTATLVQLAQDDDAPGALADAVGRTLAQICFRRSQDLDDLASANMTDAAFLGYDHEIARLQREHPHVRMSRGAIGSGR